MSTSSFCPACGGVVEGIRIVVSHGVLIHKGQQVALTAQEERIMQTLIGTWPKIVTKDQLYEVICASHIHEDDYPAPKVAEVRISMLRKKLKDAPDIGISIETISKVGYTLRVADQESSVALQIDNDNRRAEKAGLIFRISPAQEARIRELAEGGLGHMQIAPIMRMPYATVHRRLKAMGLLRAKPRKDAA